MTSVITLILVSLVVLVMLIALFNAYFQKAGQGFALIRTGVGKQLVVIDGGCLSMPFLHATERIPTGGITLSIGCEGEHMLMTVDYVPVDMVMQFVLRVEPNKDCIQRAARAVGAMNLNADDLIALFQGRFIDAMQAEISCHTLTALHQARADLAGAVKQRLDGDFEFAGLLLESAALVRFDQSPVSALNDNNALHVQGMRRVAEMVSESRKKRAETEAGAEISIRATNLLETHDRVEFERQQQEAEINLNETISKLKAESEGRASTITEQEALKSDNARLQRQRNVREAEIERDLALRKREIDSLKEAEAAQIVSRIALSKKRIDEAKADAELETSRGEVIRAQEKIQTEKELLATKRKSEQAIMRAREKGDVDAIVTRAVAVNLLEQANSEAEAAKLQAKAMTVKAHAEADGRSAVIAAENTMDEKIIRMKLERQKIETLPEVAEKISKPLEKIDSIRINHIGGAGFSGAGGDQNPSPFTETMQSILAMSVQLPALKKLGEEIGLDIDSNLATRAADAVNRAKIVPGGRGGKQADKTDAKTTIESDDDRKKS